MTTVLLQDWITIRGNGTTPVTQSAATWLDSGVHADVTFWLDVREVTNPGAGNVTLSYETSPTADERLFQAMAAITPLTAHASPPTVTKVFMNAGAAVPLARWIRWKLVGSAAGTWDATLRVFATLSAANPNH